MPDPVVRLGTRGSALARWQTDHVAGLLRAAWPGLVCTVEVFQTEGDRVLDTPLPLIGPKPPAGNGPSTPSKAKA